MADPEAAAEQRVRPGGQRLKLGEVAPAYFTALKDMEDVAAAGIDPRIAELVRLRASQLNGCSYCIDLHTRVARENGEEERRLYAVSAWRETPFFTARERAALAFAEAVTMVAELGMPDRTFDEAARLFSPEELGGLVAVCVTINVWNRIAITSRTTPRDPG